MSEHKVVVKRKLLWEVKGITRETFEENEFQDYIESDNFTIFVDGKVTEWFLRFYPKGDIEPESANYIGLYLHLKKNESGDFDTTSKFGVLSTKTDFIDTEFSKTHEDWKKSSSLGFVKWMNVEKLCNPDNAYLSEGKLTIFCEIKILMQSKSNAAADSNYFAKMFLKEDLKDCELHTSDGKVMKCHKFVLAARSPVFEAMFTTDLDEARRGVVKIPDFNSKTMEQFLRYIYCLDVKDLDEIAHVLIYAAEKYLIKQLKDLCIDSLIVSLNVMNVLQTIIIAEQVTDATNLLEESLKVLVSNYQVLSKTPEWKALPHQTLLKILDHVIPHFSNEQVRSSTSLQYWRLSNCMKEFFQTFKP